MLLLEMLVPERIPTASQVSKTCSQAILALAVGEGAAFCRDCSLLEAQSRHTGGANMSKGGVDMGKVVSVNTAPHIGVLVGRSMALVLSPADGAMHLGGTSVSLKEFPHGSALPEAVHLFLVPSQSFRPRRLGVGVLGILFIYREVHSLGQEVSAQRSMGKMGLQVALLATGSPRTSPPLPCMVHAATHSWPHTRKLQQARLGSHRHVQDLQEGLVACNTQAVQAASVRGAAMPSPPPISMAMPNLCNLRFVAPPYPCQYLSHLWHDFPVCHCGRSVLIATDCRPLSVQVVVSCVIASLDALFICWARPLVHKALCWSARCPPSKDCMCRVRACKGWAALGTPSKVCSLPHAGAFRRGLQQLHEPMLRK
jgi:hypothetical protein